MGRCSILTLALLAGAISSGCRDAGAAPLRSGARSPATLELGGDGPTIGELLRRGAGEVPAFVPVTGPQPTDVAGREARLWRTVPLRPGQTLSQLCAEELGDAARWREVVALNGWTEAQVRSLPTGEPVRLPPR